MASVESLEAAESLCPSCREGESQLERARSFGLYRDTLRAAILLLKFQRRERWGVRLGTLLVATCDDLLAMSGADEAMLVPVPLHASRFRQRGYNQAELLCRGLLRAYRYGSLKLEAGALKKTRATPPQTGLSLSARHENVRGAFEVVAPERIRGCVAVLVDDVMTTGATLAACATVLERVGARKVLGLTLARATPQFPDTAGDRGVV